MMERVKELLGARQSDSTTMSHLLGLLMNYATVLRAAAYHGNSPLIVALLNGGAAIDAAPSPDRYHAGSMLRGRFLMLERRLLLSSRQA